MSKRELEMLWQRLEEDGLRAVTDGIVEHFAPPDPEKEIEAAKN